MVEWSRVEQITENTRKKNNQKERTGEQTRYFDLLTLIDISLVFICVYICSCILLMRLTF